MSSHAYLYADGEELFSWKNELDYSILGVFTKTDLIEKSGLSAKKLSKKLGLEHYADDYFDDEGFKLTLLATSAHQLKHRLNVMGYGELAFKDFLVAVLEYDRDFAEYSSNPEMADYYKAQLTEIQEILEKLPRLHELSENASKRLDDILELNPCHALYHKLKDTPDSKQVVIDVSEFAYDGWFDETYLEHKEHIGELGRASTPPIILTEGVFDRRVLKESLHILYPHLSEFVRFLDTDYKTEGGAGALVKTLKSFAAAGISNRILAIFDNDTAAHEALTSLNQSSLPHNYKIMHYPTLETAKNYPTIGPQGNYEMDINGLAGAIELYLGNDILQDPSSRNYRPIQWTGYSQKLQKYQGELIGKSEAQKLFELKLKMAKGHGRGRKDLDWSGVRLILDAMITKLSTF